MYLKIKRATDFIISLLGLIVLSPVFLVIAISVKLTSRGPIFFRQKRVGINKSHFTILKFRTMRVEAPKDVPTHLMETPDPFMTPIGSFLRRTSLDELPQLVNILRGEMSIVGPRPALWNQYDLIAERDKYTVPNGLTPNTVRPGLTGWAQINGRDELAIVTKARLDGVYVAKMSLRFDCRCFFGTVKKVLHGDGVLEGCTEKEEDRTTETMVGK